MISQDEVVVRLGLDARDFERRLREADTIARKYANRTGAALNTGSPDGSIPQSWQGIANLSRRSQEAIREGKGLSGVLQGLHTHMMRVSPMGMRVAETLAQIGIRSSLVVAPIAGVVGALSMMRNAYREVKEASNLDVSVSFLRELRVAANMAGEKVEETGVRIMKFQQVLASAAEGNKEALASLNRVGIKDPTGKTLEENLRDAATGLGAITDKAKQAKAAVELFGRGAQASMPDILAELGRGNRNGVFGSANEDTATLSAGWMSAKKLWSKTGGGLWRYFKEGSESVLASWLQTYAGINGEESSPSKLEKTESPEAKAAREAKAKKFAEDLTQARKEYAQAVEAGYTTEQKAIDAGLKVMRIRERLKDLGLDELERTKLQTELVKEQTRYQEMHKASVEAQKAAAEKRLSYERQLNDLQQQRAALEKTMRDRSGWTVGEVMGLGKQFKTDRDGLPILPDDMLQSIERALGRRLGNGEIQEMRRRSGVAIGKANDVTTLQNAAHWMSLMGLGDMADSFMKRGDAIRKGLNGLTSSEKDPMAEAAKSMAAVDKNISDLVTLAAKDGIIIKPRMGK